MGLLILLLLCERLYAEPSSLIPLVLVVGSRTHASGPWEEVLDGEGRTWAKIKKYEEKDTEISMAIFSAEQEVHLRQLTFYNPSNSPTAVQNFKVMISQSGFEKKDFTLLFQGTLQSVSSSQTFHFLPTKAKHMAIILLDNYGDPDWYTLCEFEAYGTL